MSMLAKAWRRWWYRIPSTPARLAVWRQCQPKVVVVDRLPVTVQHEPVVATAHVAGEPVEHPLRRWDGADAAGRLGWRELGQPAARHPLPVDAHAAFEPQHAVDRQSARLRVGQPKPGTEHNRRGTSEDRHRHAVVSMRLLTRGSTRGTIADGRSL